MTLSELPRRQQVVVGLDEPTSPTTNAIPYLPTTPPKPQPPPKDVLLSATSPNEFRMSRSMENFSRPTRLSMAAVELSPPPTASARHSPHSSASGFNAATKPLPHLPVTPVVHAVSTMDDVALPLRTAPLPPPPKPLMDVLEEEVVITEEEESVLPTVIPATKSVDRLQKRRSQSSGDIPFDSVPFSTVFQKTTPSVASRFSSGTRAVDIKDWEDAIDDSWDYDAAVEQPDYSQSAVLPNHATSMQLPQDRYLLVEQTIQEETSSSSSTPLMMQGSDKPLRHGSTDTSEGPTAPFQGLGIRSSNSTPAFLLEKASAPSDRRSEISFSYSDIYRSQGMRSPVSMMSKSSSQESMIASIFGTHRSSNSSTSFSDFATIATDSFGGSVDNLKLDLQDFFTSPATEKHLREGSQDTIREDSRQDRPVEADSSIGTSIPLTTSPTIQHGRGASTPNLPKLPVRKSSIPTVSDGQSAQVGRRRANTGTSRPKRNTRASYSLFPTTTQV
jgi:hypothetical protein